MNLPRSKPYRIPISGPLLQDVLSKSDLVGRDYRCNGINIHSRRPVRKPGLAWWENRAAGDISLGTRPQAEQAGEEMG